MGWVMVSFVKLPFPFEKEWMELSGTAREGQSWREFCSRMKERKHALSSFNN
jgi:hypothetical protein